MTLDILLISNMYPDDQNPSSGIFVKKVYDQLSSFEDLNLKKSCLTKSSFRSYDYLIFYIKSIFCILFQKSNLIYIHYISRTGLLGVLGKLLLKKKLISNCHGSDIFIPYRKNSFMHSLNKFVLRKSDLIIVPSNFFKTFMIENLNIDPEKLFVSPSGGVYLPKNIDEKPYLTENLRLGYVGNISEEKGFKIILSFLDSVDFNCTFYLAGKDSNDMIKLIKNPLIRVKYLGEVKRNELHVLYSSIDLFLYPSLLMEGLGLSPIEAMAHKVPVVASNIGAIGSYVQENYNGFLINPGDKQEFKKKILSFKDMDNFERNELGANAKKTAELFDEKIVKLNLKKKLIDISDDK
tara:strand:+ start:272 stop:1321 length:1050 start_codon:yes stop_codon:yes gene_type:complete